MDGVNVCVGFKQHNREVYVIGENIDYSQRHFPRTFSGQSKNKA